MAQSPSKISLALLPYDRLLHAYSARTRRTKTVKYGKLKTRAYASHIANLQDDESKSLWLWAKGTNREFGMSFMRPGTRGEYF